MANWVLSINRLRSAALSVNLCVISPGARSGKSLSGSVCSVKRERPARIASAARSPEDSSTICAPSGSLRTMSKNICAGTVVEPPGPTSAGMVSVTSISRSVDFRLSLDLSARTSTLARIGIVLRRSTTRCTWPRDFSSAERSTVTFIATSVPTAHEKGGSQKWRGDQSYARPGGHGLGLFGAFSRPFHSLCQVSRSVLQLAFESLDLVGERRISAGERLDLAHGVQHRGVIAATEPAADLGQ